MPIKLKKESNKILSKKKNHIKIKWKKLAKGILWIYEDDNILKFRITSRKVTWLGSMTTTIKFNAWNIKNVNHLQIKILTKSDMNKKTAKRGQKVALFYWNSIWPVN